MDTSKWKRITKYASKAGAYAKAVTEASYLTWKDPRTPSHVKVAIASALIYFLSPIDAIPDFLPGGFTDDMALLVSTLYLVGTVGKEHLKNSKEKHMKNPEDKNSDEK